MEHLRLIGVVHERLRLLGADRSQLRRPSSLNKSQLGRKSSTFVPWGEVTAGRPRSKLPSRPVGRSDIDSRESEEAIVKNYYLQLVCHLTPQLVRRDIHRLVLVHGREKACEMLPARQ